jgi:hypothetical protein
MSRENGANAEPAIALATAQLWLEWTIEDFLAANPSSDSALPKVE